MAIGPLIRVATPSAAPHQISARDSPLSKKRCICQMPRTMKAVKPRSMRAVCAEPQIISDVAQMYTASGPPIRHISQSRKANPAIDGRTKAQVE